MTRQTSIDAYNKIKNDGLLTRLRWEVYKVLYEHGPLTANELAVRYFSSLQYQSVSSRFSELRDMGVVQELGKKKDDYTKMSVILWDVTDQIPSKLIKKESKSSKKIKEAVLKEREECVEIVKTNCDSYHCGQEIITAIRGK